MGRILRAIWNRQVAKHGSVAALAIGALASALGIPLAPEQVSALIWAGSIVLYIVSQIRGLWRPDPKPPETVVRLPTAKLLLAMLAIGLAFSSPRAVRADENVTMIWAEVTTGDDDSILSADNAVDRYGIGCSNTEADVLAAEGDETKYVYTQSIAGFAVTHTFAPGDWYCVLYAHNATGWSERSNVLMFTVTAPAPIKRRPHRPVLRRQ